MNNKLTLIARLLMGIGFTIFGLNGFLHFIPMQPMPDAAGAFMGALMATGYMFPFIFATQLIAGLLFLSGMFVPLAIVMIAPVLLHILGFHIFVSPGIAAGLLMSVLEIYLAFFSPEYSPVIKQLFRKKP